MQINYIHAVESVMIIKREENIFWEKSTITAVLKCFHLFYHKLQSILFLCIYMFPVDYCFITFRLQVLIHFTRLYT